MFIINFNDLKKGQTIRGGLTPVRILLTLAYLKFKGYKPFRYQGDKTKIKVKGWFVSKGYGGKSGEPLIRFNFGSKFSSFHAYNRRGKPRVTQNWYVAFKSRLAQKLVA
tara:strand:+ start:337 stop:663 length:327 start_codon:yes stop_codon:yes gene_type:complete